MLLKPLDSQLLVSAGRYPFDKGTQTKLPNHLLVDFQDDKAFVKSEIRWQRGILFGPAKGLYYGPAKANGVISSRYLLLAKNLSTGQKLKNISEKGFHEK